MRFLGHSVPEIWPRLGFRGQKRPKKAQNHYSVRSLVWPLQDRKGRIALCMASSRFGQKLICTDKGATPPGGRIWKLSINVLENS